ncbi:ATP-binding protein [Streptomyces sp. NPDC052396]|uniref:ATP-binding protein n=1 Tax=Streptomyces sp. NPDC052396 TaxID=3365689 RepID=UPI0037D4BF39
MADHRFALELVLGPAELSSVRRIARAQLDRWGWGPADDALTIVNELLTNVVDHVPDRWCALLMRREEATLHIYVQDASPALPVRRPVNSRSTAGRGLALIDELTRQRWQVVPTTGGGKEVRCLLGARCTRCAEIKAGYRRSAEAGDREAAEEWIVTMGRHQRQAHDTLSGAAPSPVPYATASRDCARRTDR